MQAYHANPISEMSREGMIHDTHSALLDLHLSK